MEELTIGFSKDYFDTESSFALKGYLSLPEKASIIVLFQPDLFSSGNDAFANRLASSLREKDIAMLSIDNSGSAQLGGKSEGSERDYLPEQMVSDVVTAVDYIENSDRFSSLKIILLSYSYGCIATAASLTDTVHSIDGAIFLSSPEKGMDVFEEYISGKFTEEKNELDEKTLKVNFEGKEFNLSGLFFSEKRKGLNIFPIVEVVYNTKVLTHIKVKFIYPDKSSQEKIDNINDTDPFVVIEGAQRDYANKWKELISEIESFCSEIK